MNMFEEIDKVKKDLPKLNNVSKEVQKVEINLYQEISIVLLIIGLFTGVFLGNLFPSCGSSSSFYSTICSTTEFNFSLMLFVWFISFLVFLFFYGIGQIIALLSSINDKLDKKKQK